MSWFDFDTQLDALKNPFDFKKASAAFKQVDPLLGYGVPALMSAEDKALSKTWGALGVDSLSDMFAKDSGDTNSALRHRGIAGLAALGGAALGGAGAASGAGGGAASGAASTTPATTGGLTGAWNTFNGYVKPISQGLGYAQQAQGILGGGQQQQAPAPQMAGGGGGQSVSAPINGILTAQAQLEQQRQDAIRKRAAGILGSTYG